MYSLLTASPVGRVGSRAGERSLSRGEGFGATIAVWKGSADAPIASRRAAIVAGSFGTCAEAGAGAGAFLTAAAKRVRLGS